MGQFFIYLHNFLKGKKWLLSLLVVVFLGLVTYSAFNIKTDEDFLALFPQNEEFNKYSLVLRHSSISDKIIVFISANDTSASNKTDLLIKNADFIVEKINLDFSPQIKEIKYKISDDEILLMYDFFYDHLPLFLDASDYEKISKRISETSIDTTLHNNFQLLISPAGIALRKFLLKDPFGFIGLAMEKLNQFQLGDNFTIVQNRIFSKDKNSLFFFINVANASDTRQMEALVEGIDALVSEKGNGEFQFHCYGSPIVAAANSRQVKNDLYITLTITLLFIFVFLTFYFRNFLIPVLLLIPVIVGAGFSLIVVYFVRGQVSAISLGVGSVLLGIGIDYSLHFLTHYKQAGSIADLYKSISTPVLMSSVTTAAAFSCLFIIKSSMFQDLGFFAAVSVLSTAFAALIVLPIIFSKIKIKHTKKRRFIFPDNISRYKPENSKWLILTVFLLSIIFYFTGKFTTFNENMMDMNYMTDKLKEDEKYLNKKTDFVLSSLFAISEGETFEQALLASEKLSETLREMKTEGTIAGYFTVNSLVISPELQKQKIRDWNFFWSDKNELLISSMIEKGKTNHFRPEAFDEFKNLISKTFTPIPLEKFSGLIHAFFADYIIDDSEITAIVTTIKTESSKKAAVHERLKSVSSSFLIDSQKITQDLFDVVKSQFKALILFSSLIVFIILLIAFGRIELAIISYVPIVFSWVWTIGIMGLFNIQFNIFNIIISTFIFGLGVDYSIFITRGLLYKLQYNQDHLVTFKTSILLSGITTLLGTGVLIFAQHPAIKSIALVSVIGISSAIFITFTIQPYLFNFLTSYKGKKRALPVTFYNFFFSITSLLYFLIATVFSFLVIIPLVKILPLTTKTKNLIAHRVIHFFSKTVVYWNVQLAKVLINIDKQTFKKPSLIISNHQSSLDLVFLLMLHPRIVILSNKNAWRNTFYGPIIRFAGFIYVDEGLDAVAEVVDQRIKEGYSVLIFPEGTRSIDGKIKRFHKGAFYVAEKLNLEILPIMLHGAYEAMSKKEFFLRRGRIHIQVFDKINLRSGKWGTNNSEHAKNVVKFYRQEFQKIDLAIKVPKRLKVNLINRYIYRGPILEWYMRTKLKLENNYNIINNIVPRKAVITDIGCGYGFLPTMLALVSEEREITGIDYDDDKIITAQHCTEDLKNLSFKVADAVGFRVPPSDVIILSDVLHYISLQKQKQLLQNCFEALNYKGVIIIRDADADYNRRTIGTRLTEFFSTRMGFNKTAEDLTFVSGKIIEDFAREHQFKVERIDNTRFTSNIFYIIRK